MLLPGRDTFDPQYRFGFNGKENELDFRGIGNITEYGARIYNARLGKFLSIDPLTKSYPWYSPYQFAGNKPIIAVDLDGLEEKMVIASSVSRTKPISQMQTAIGLKEKSEVVAAAYYGVINRLQLAELNNPIEPRNAAEFGTMGELTVEEKRNVIESTVSQFIICKSSSNTINPTVDPNKVIETYTEVYDFNYTLLGNKEKIDDIKSSIKTATTVIDYASKIRDVTGKLPKFLDKVSTPSSILGGIVEGDGLGVVTEISKIIVGKGLTELAKKAPYLNQAIGFVKSNPITMTISMSFSNSAPDFKFDEQKKENAEKLKMRTIGALLFLFENNNKLHKVEYDESKRGVDNVQVAIPRK